MKDLKEFRQPSALAYLGDHRRQADSIAEDNDKNHQLEPGAVITLPQLCQNYLLLCVLIGKWSRSATSKTS